MEGLLLLYLFLHLRLTVAGLAQGISPDLTSVQAFVWGWFAFPTGAPHRVLVMTVALLILHAFACWHAISESSDPEPEGGDPTVV